jgi:hypothetical protein
MKLQRLAAPYLAVISIMACPLVAQKNQDNPIIGTWKMNVEKSKYSTGSPPKSATLTVEAQGKAEKTTYTEIGPDGSETTYTYTANYDRKDDPISGSGRTTWRDDLLGGAETIALARDSNLYSIVLKKSGNVVMTNRAVVSKSGKVLTITANGADVKGQPTKFVTVWEKQ